MCELKICGGNCKRELPTTSEFFAERKLKTKNVLQWQCRDCQKEYRKIHYDNNKQKYIDKAKINTKIQVDKFKEFKKTLKCSECNEKRWWVLDFHHVDSNEKEYNVSNMIRNCSFKKIKKEIEKCIILCSNCHRDLHYQEKINAGDA